MRTTTKWIATATLALALLALGSAARAQTPTAEGTVITNTAHATWTDANSNTYTEATASVSVTVGFQAGVDVTTATATVTPGAPSSSNEVTLSIKNGGNGADSMSVAMSIPAGLTVTGYKIGATPYGTLAALNAALAATSIAAGSSVDVVVVYDVAGDQGGQNLSLSMTATSRRSSGVNDTQAISVQPSASNGLTVTPDGTPVNRLPSNGTQYSQDFTVTNTSNGSHLIDLVAARSGSVLTIVSVNGTAGSSASITLGAGANQTVTVVYTVGAASAGATDSLKLTGTLNGTSTSDIGSFIVTVVKPALTVAKAAFRDDKTTAIGGSDRVLPGEYIQYKVTVTNSGSADASGISVSDPLPAAVTYQSTSPDSGSEWTLGESGGTVTGTLSGTLAPAASRFFWIRVLIK